MNNQSICDAIKANNDFESVANAIGVTIDTLKVKLIDAIKNSESKRYLQDVANDQSEPFTTKRRYVDSEDSKDKETKDKDSKDKETKEEYDSDDVNYDSIIRDSPINLSDEQRAFLFSAVKERKNMFLVAPAGCGKSTTINTMIELFQTELEPYSNEWFQGRYKRFCDVDTLRKCSTVGVCASTGRAASLIKGRTLHSYLGIGLAKSSASDLARRLATAKYLRGTFDALRAVQVIVIDEVSMISGQLLDKISDYLKKIRQSDAPFGGIQMILIGDMAQLSPIGSDSTFIFESKEFKSADIHIHHLTKCFRQSDPVFLKILNEIRYGNCSDESYDILQSQTSIDQNILQNIKPMKILSTNAEVDRINETELVKVCEESNSTIAVFPIKIRSGQSKAAEKYRNVDMIPEQVKLAVGAHIVVTHNISPTLVNGSQGKVVRIGTNGIIAEMVDGHIVSISYIDYKDPDHPCIFTAKAIFSYLPVRLAWAATIHKIQGANIQLLEVDLSKVFCHGQAYVAISRCTSLKGLIVKGLSKRAFICHKSVKAFYGIK